MTPYEFGYALGHEKQALNFGGLMQGATRGATIINNGAKNLIRGVGNASTGLGHVSNVAGSIARTTGRGMMRGGRIINEMADGAGRGFIHDLLTTLGSGSRTLGRATFTAGNASKMLGEGLHATGKGVRRVSRAGYGVPTAVVGGSALGAGKMMLGNDD